MSYVNSSSNTIFEEERKYLLNLAIGILLHNDSKYLLLRQYALIFLIHSSHPIISHHIKTDPKTSAWIKIFTFQTPRFQTNDLRN